MMLSVLNYGMTGRVRVLAATEQPQREADRSHVPTVQMMVSFRPAQPVARGSRHGVMLSTEKFEMGPRSYVENLWAVYLRRHALCYYFSV